MGGVQSISVLLLWTVECEQIWLRLGMLRNHEELSLAVLEEQKGGLWARRSNTEEGPRA